MSDTKPTVSHPLTIRVELAGLDFNGRVQAIVAEAARACGGLLRQGMVAVERAASSAGADPVGESGSAEAAAWRRWRMAKGPATRSRIGSPSWSEPWRSGTAWSAS